MTDNRFEGKWDRMKGKVREHWGRLTDDDVEQVRGKRENPLGKIQETYGGTRDKAEAKLKEFERRF